MNDLVKALVEGLIEVNELTNKKIVGMFGGGFKPPTSGHLEVVKRALEENPELDELIILVGSGTRDSISQEESLAIWNMYKKYLPSKVKVMASPKNKPPIGAIYSYAKKNPDEIIYWFIGAREGNEGDFQDIEKRTRSLRKLAYQNVKVKEIVTGGAVSGTKARQALLAQDKETFIQFLPDIPEVDEIWDMLKDIVQERVRFTPDFVTQGDVEFVDDFADKKLAPIDIDLTGNHFFDRLNDPRNRPDISVEELEEFFDKLADEKEDFIEFLRQYRDVVVKDTDTNINIPFMKRANKAIAKTIMRKKNFMTSNKVLPLEEGRYDREVTMVSNMVVNYFKDVFGEKTSETFEDAGELGDDTYNLIVDFIPSDFKTLGPLPFIINAAAGENDMAIQIDYQSTMFPEAYNELIPELKDAIRHELEHIAQYRFDKGVTPDEANQDDLDLVDYLTLDYEIPAFVQGIYKQAKTKKISFTDALDEFLDDRLDELDPKEVTRVRRAYIAYAKKNLPAAQLNEKYSKIEEISIDLSNYSGQILPGDVLRAPKGFPLGGKKLEKSKIVKVIKNSREGVNRYKLTVEDQDGKQYTVRNFEMDGEYKGKKLPKFGLIRRSKKNLQERDPKKGTGKKPKGSGRRLYTDEDPSDTVKVKFSTRQDIVDTLNKTSFKNKSHARQSQVINLIHQRVRAALSRTKDPKKKKRLQTAFDYIKKRKEASKAKTKRLQAQKKKKKANENVAPNHNQKAAPYGSGYKKMEEGDTYEKMAAKGKKSGNLKQGTVRKRLNIPKDEKVPMYKIDKEISRLKKMDKDKDKKGVQLGDKNQKYYKALQLAKTLKSTTNLKENYEGQLESYIESLTDYMGSNGLNLKPYPSLEYIESDKENAANIFGRTAYYMPSEQKIVLYTMGRHPKDILRSYAHELVHHHQNLNGTLDHSQTTNTNEDDALDRIEREAYENGNILFRNWEDSIKNQ